MGKNKTRTAEEWRRAWLNGPAMLFVQKCFDKYPELRSVGALVAQYWDDEADDATHLCWIASVHPTIDMHEYCRWAQVQDKAVNHCAEYNTLTESTDSPHAKINVVEEQCYLNTAENFGVRRWVMWDSNTTARDLFSCYVKEPGSQDMSMQDAYNLFCTFTRGTEGDITWRYSTEPYRPFASREGDIPSQNRDMLKNILAVEARNVLLNVMNKPFMEVCSYAD